MLEESLIKTNFVGRDGFRWWIGQIAPQEAQGAQVNGGGWGNRFKVRIMGYHPYSVVELPDEDLPWAQALLGCSDGSGAANRGTSVKLAPGDSVLGFFLDGDNAQIPVILGVFGRTSSVPSKEYSGPFKAFTGYTGRVKNDGTTLATSQSNESNANAQKSPRSVSKEDAKKIGQGSGANDNPETREISASGAIGKKVTAASSGKESALQTIKNDVDNFVKRIKEITDGIQGALNGVNKKIGKIKQDILKEIDGMTASIQKGVARMVNDMTKKLSDAMTPVLNKGLQVLYDTVYALVLAATQSDPIAVKAGTIAQALLIGPVKQLSDAMPCIANSVINGIGSTIKGVLESVVDNVTNFVSCIGDQVVGALLNHVIGGVTKFLEPLMSAVEKISMGFSPLSFLRGNADAMLSALDSLSCNAIAPEFDLASNEWVIGKGSSDKVGVPVDKILEVANEAQALADSALGIVQDITELSDSALGIFDFANPSVSIPGFKSALGNCFAGPPELGGCGGTKIKIFGGNGSGGTAKAIFGAITSIANGGRGLTGSVIGVDLVNGGGGYTFPPFVEIVDECSRGYGASARAVIDYDPESPTYQQITDIYIVTEGENYTVGDDVEDYVPDDVNGPIIVEPGEGYTGTDKVLDNSGNQYQIKVDGQGRIYDVIRIPGNDYASTKDFVEYDVISDTGFGAKLKPRLIRRPVQPQGEVKRVIDCIE